MFPGSGPGEMLFNVVPYFIAIVFIIVISIFLFSIMKGIKQWSYNNSQPVLTVPAKIVSKHTKVRNHTHHHDDHHHHTTSTSYFVTFEVESGDRMEFQVHGKDFGLLAEGDQGKLTFQGTRFKGFERVW